MKGLFVKDLELMKQQKQFFIMVIAMGIILNLTGSGGSFAIGYFTIITAIFALTTMSYDEFDNGFAFLMTMPATRKQYVAEKYLFGIGLTVVAWVVAEILGVSCQLAMNQASNINESLLEGATTIPIALLMLAVFIPLGIQFGVEKGRYIAIVLWVIIIVIVYGLVKTKGLSESMIDAWIDRLNWGLVVAGAVLVTAIGYLGSYWLSVRLMEHKEF